MGCDGGTIPTRDELVKTKKNAEKKDKDSVRIYKWQNCHLTQDTLVRPIVACELGRLYNKEAIIKNLLKKKNVHDSTEDYVADNTSVDHIRSLKDIKELLLTENPVFAKHKSGPSLGHGVVLSNGAYVDSRMSPFICPLTGLEMNGTYPFIFDWATGKVLSERGYKIVRSDPNDSIAEEDIVYLNPEENSENANTMADKMQARRTKAKLLKKLTKEGKRKNKTDDKSVVLFEAKKSKVV